MPVDDVNEQIWRELSTLETFDGGMREQFAAGLPIYYAKADTPAGLVIKEFPDGHRELVRHHRTGDEVIKAL
ncbi:hypothetical protein [Terriglobus sp.]|uniref:hypothetical protein n=1 Tax=Terriglobus sp. TaxID=1889013 RepID=UPI003AFFE49F